MEYQNLNWYPGHMAKTKRLMMENLKLVDIIAEIIDARIPLSSRNPDFDYIFNTKPRIVILNKSDISDNNQNKLWIEHFNKNNIPAILTDCKSGNGIAEFPTVVRKVLSDLLERRNTRGISGMSIKIMVVGIPNCGKSSFINRISGSKSAKVEDRPGVTRGKQWIGASGGLELLDMPGVLWPKIENPVYALNLAVTGAIKDDITDIEYTAGYLLGLLNKNYHQLLMQRYKLDDNLNMENTELLRTIAKKRGFLLSKGEYDIQRAAMIVLDEFRGQKIGRITLERL